MSWTREFETASFKSRKMIGTGIFLSKLINLMPLWSGCEDYLVKLLQVVQNKAARSIAKLSFSTPSRHYWRLVGGCQSDSSWPTTACSFFTKPLTNKLQSICTRRWQQVESFLTRQDRQLLVQQSSALMSSILLTVENLDMSQAVLRRTSPSRLEKKLQNSKKELKEWVEININIWKYT